MAGDEEAEFEAEGPGVPGVPGVPVPGPGLLVAFLCFLYLTLYML